MNAQVGDFAVTYNFRFAYFEAMISNLKRFCLFLKKIDKNLN